MGTKVIMAKRDNSLTKGNMYLRIHKRQIPCLGNKKLLGNC